MEQKTEVKGEWERRRDWRSPVTPDSVCQVWEKDVGDGSVLVLVGRERRNGGPPVWHLSISHGYNNVLGNNRIPGRIPAYADIKEARYRFVPDDVNMAMMFPPRRHYINVHPTTIHLWEVPMEMAELA